MSTTMSSVAPGGIAPPPVVVVVRGMRAPHEDPGAIYAQMQQELLRPVQWQNPEVDKPFRQAMIGRIHHILRLRKPDAEQDWLKRLPEMAKRLEDSLYRSATSLNEYDDEGTLKMRLQQIAQDLKGVNGAAAHQGANRNAPQLPVITASTIPADYPPRPAVAVAVAAARQPSPGMPPAAPAALPPSTGGGFPGTPFPSGTPQMTSGSQPTPYAPMVGTPYMSQTEYFPGEAAAAAAPSSSQQQPVASPPPSASATRPTQSDVLRQQQQRLLLLRHASKCPTAPGETCPATIHCHPMKVLWKHIAVCKDPQCPTAHCVSSRFVLAHYHKCVDSSCGVCEPVRQAIRKNSEPKPPQQQQAVPPPMGYGTPSQQQQPLPLQPPPPATAVAQQQQQQVDLVARYVALWKSININAASAKEKQAQLEAATREVAQKEHELKIAEQEAAAHAMHEIRDDVWESHNDMLKLRVDTYAQNAKSAAMQRRLLEAEVQKMRNTHDRNVEKEKNLQIEFTQLYPGESGKAAIMHARQEAQNQLQQQQQSLFPPSASAAAHLQHKHSQQNIMPKQPPIAQVATQQVISQQITKKGKNGAAAAAAGGGVPAAAKPKKSRKQQQQQASSSTQPSPAAGVAVAAAYPQQHAAAAAAAAAAAMTSSYRPPPSPKSGAPASKRMSLSADALAIAAGPKKLEHIVPMFRECPSYSPTIFETSLINTLNRVDIQRHVQFLSNFARESEMQSKASKFREICSMLLRKCEEADVDNIFAQPVDPIQDAAPNYLEIIKRPMDFSTIKSKIEANVYTPDLKAFMADMRLVFANCLLFNPPSSIYYGMGLRVGQLLEREYARLADMEEEKLAASKYNINHCSLCYGTKLLFEQIVYFCSGPCGKRIPKSSSFFTTTDNRHFCSACLNEMEDVIPLANGLTMAKRELKKDKLPEPQEEGFVSCYSCKRWMHQICAMLNTKRGQDSAKDDFLCPSCVLQVTDYHPKLAENYRKKCTARDLPETDFSKFVEARLLAKMERLRAEHLAKPSANTALAQEFEEAKTLCVRIVMARDAEVWTRTGMKRMYPDFPQVFPSKQRVLLLFQKLDGVDVLLFIMYLQEYGSDCPAPNTRCVYLAYLDSVNYLRPAICRTNVYHELIIHTMAFERSRGFTKFFIWACPPVGGDDYIFHVHPKAQKTPKPERLRLWYFTLLESARQQGVVVSISNFFDEYFARVSELKSIPYFEGDCWTGFAELYLTEAENKGQDYKALASVTDIINKAHARRQAADRSLSAHHNHVFASTAGDGGGWAANGAAGSAGGGGLSGKRQGSIPSKRGRKRSQLDGAASATEQQHEESLSPVMEESLSVTPALPHLMLPPALICPPPRALEQVPMQSALTWRIANEMERMRDDFIVVKLVYDCVQCATSQDFPGAVYWLPKQYSPELDPHDYKKKRYAPPYCLCHECYQAAYQAEFGRAVDCSSVPSFPPPEWQQEYDEYLAQRAKEEEGASGHASQSSPPVVSPSHPATTAAAPAAASATNKRTSSRKRRAEDVDHLGNGDERDLAMERGIELLEFGKNSRPPNPYGPTPPCSMADFRPEVAMIRPSTNTGMADESPNECVIFNIRDDFLELCKGNKYQFDDLRRAKHSSAMVLFHLHNPESDGFVRSCNHCHADIQGVRYSCIGPCPDFDLCPKCHETVPHEHELQMLGASSGGSSMASPSASSVPLQQQQQQQHLQQQQHPQQHQLASAASSSSGMGGAPLHPGLLPGASAAETEALQEQKRIVTTQILEAFPHASTCQGGCNVQYCDKTKKLFEHLSKCQIKGGCTSCKRGWYLMTYHSRICRMPQGRCTVPHCEELKERSRTSSNLSSDRRVMALMQRQTQQQQQQQQQSDETASPLSPDSAATAAAAAAAATTTGESATVPVTAAATGALPPPPPRPNALGGKGKRPLPPPVTTSIPAATPAVGIMEEESGATAAAAAVAVVPVDQQQQLAEAEPPV